MSRLLNVILAVACIALVVALVQARKQQTLEPPGRREIVSAKDSLIEADALLSQRIPHIRFDDITLERAINTLSDLAKVDISADWRAIEYDGIARSTNLRLSLSDIRLDDALAALLARATVGHPHALGFMVQNGVVIVTSADDIRRFRTTEVMSIGPLLDRLGIGAVRMHRDEGQVWIDRHEMGSTLIELIKDSVDRESWDTGGEDTGIVQQVGGLLVVRNTPPALRKTRALLDALIRAADGDPSCSITGKFAMPIVTPSTNDGLTTRPEMITECFDTRPLIKEILKARAARGDGNHVLPTDLEVLEDLFQLLQNHVDSPSWLDSGGTGVMREIGGILVITQTRANMQAIRQLMSNVHEMVATNASFPTTTRSSSGTTRP